MDKIETAIRAIKDRIASALGELDEAASNASRAENHRRLSSAARDLHRAADDLQNMLMRIKPRRSGE